MQLTGQGGGIGLARSEKMLAGMEVLLENFKLLKWCQGVSGLWDFLELTTHFLSFFFFQFILSGG